MTKKLRVVVGGEYIQGNDRIHAHFIATLHGSGGWIMHAVHVRSFNSILVHTMEAKIGMNGHIFS